MPQGRLELGEVSGRMLAVLGSFADVPLVSFDGAIPLSKFVQLNDPVMGGQSDSTFAIHDGVGEFSGTCRIVPKLKVPKPPHLEERYRQRRENR